MINLQNETAIVALGQTIADNLSVALAAEAGITAGELTTFETELATFISDRNLVLTKEAEKKASVVTKNDDKEALLATMRSIINRLYASPNISNAELASVGLPTRDVEPTPSIAQQPLDLVATPFAAGYNKLAWARNGNKQTAIFLIDYKIEDGEWSRLAQTNATRFTHEGTVPGQMVSYRVWAETTNNLSPASNVASVYASVADTYDLVLEADAA